MAIVPMVAVMYARAPTRPKGRSIRMQALPVVHSADLILPAVIDVGYSATVDIRPRWPIVNY